MKRRAWTTGFLVLFNLFPLALLIAKIENWPRVELWTSIGGNIWLFTFEVSEELF